MTDTRRTFLQKLSASIAAIAVAKELSVPLPQPAAPPSVGAPQVRPLEAIAWTVERREHGIISFEIVSETPDSFLYLTRCFDAGEEAKIWFGGESVTGRLIELEQTIIHRVSYPGRWTVRGKLYVAHA